MRRLLSLPNAVKDYNQLHHRSGKEWFCTRPRQTVGIGEWYDLVAGRVLPDEIRVDFNDWLSAEKRILIHAGGQSRRLPAYAVTGR